MLTSMPKAGQMSLSPGVAQCVALILKTLRRDHRALPHHAEHGGGGPRSFVVRGLNTPRTFTRHVSKLKRVEAPREAATMNKALRSEWWTGPCINSSPHLRE